MLDRLRELTDLIPGVSPDSLVKKVFSEFLRGFLNISKLPSTHPLYDIALRFLRSVIINHRIELQKNPQGVGVVAGAGWSALGTFTEGWPADCISMAADVAVERYSDTGGGDLVDFLKDPAHVEMMNHPELRTFMTILKIGRAAPMKLVMLSEKLGASMTAIVGSWGLDLTTATEAQVLEKIAGQQALSPAPVANIPPPSPDPVEDVPGAEEPGEDDLGDLFSGLPDE